MAYSQRTGDSRPVVNTYRLQLNRDFGFQGTTKIVPYLKKLGISHLYASPIFAAQPGSGHGYNVIDPTRLNPELGTPSDFEELVDTLHEQDMGLIIDIVPNHQATSELNPAWMSVLQLGPESPEASTFDIDWDRDGGKVNLPILGRPLNAALQAGEIRLDQDGPTPMIRYYDHRLPLAPESRERYADLIAGAPADRQLLADLLEMQHYRLAYWREAAEQLNYRRFFDINDLIGVRVEDRDVFESTHELVFSLVASGAIDGVRIDHIDGLADPRRYLQRLEYKLRGLTYPKHCYTVVEKILARDEKLDTDWPVDGTTGYDFLRVVNDVFVDPVGLLSLEDDYAARLGSADVFASTAYQAKRQIVESIFAGDFDALVGRIQAIAEHLSEFAGITPSAIREALTEATCRLNVYRTYCYRGGLTDLDRQRIDGAVAEAQAVPDLDPRALDLVRRVLTFDSAGSKSYDAIAECQPIVDRWQQLSGAVMAKSVEDTAFYRYCPLLSLNDVGSDPNVPDDPVQAFHDWNERAATRWPRTMTTTSTHDTKRGEDARARLDVLSEIPLTWNEATGRWSRLNEHRKRSVSGEAAPDIHDEIFIYQTLVAVWPPDNSLNDELRERLHTYLTKGLREGKRQTSWREPSEPYEQAAHHFLRAILDPATGREFVDDVSRFVERVGPVGAINALSQLLLKLTAVGVPDTYRGTENWDLSLADPDNRRPIDFDALRRQLQALELIRLDAVGGEAVTELLADWKDGRIKLYLLSRVLSFRREHSRLFLEGGYLPLAVDGKQSAHVVAFARHSDVDWSLTIVPRLMVEITDQSTIPSDPVLWANTRLSLPEGSPTNWRDVLTGTTLQAVHQSGSEVLRIDEVFRYAPFALLSATSR